MSENRRLEKLWDDVEMAKRKDHVENEIEKRKFAELVKNGLGDHMNNINSYIKPEPSFFTKVKNKINKIFRYI